MNKLWILVWIFLTISVAHAQPNISITAGTVTGCTGDTVLVPITTTSANGVAAISLALNYNQQSLTYVGFSNASTQIGNSLLINAIGGRLLASWFSTAAINLNSGVLFEARFVVGGPSALSWDLATAGNCEIADINGDAIPVSFLNGALNTTGASITGQPTGNTQIQVNGSTSFSVAANGANGYQWQVLNGQQWANLQNNNLYSGTTTNSLSITAAPLSLDNSTYRVLVQGSCPLPVVSDPITLFVTGGSTIGAINLPITWDDPALVYTVTDFGGALSLLAPDPTNTANTTLRTQKTAGAQTWAGTTLSPPAGLGTAIPFAAGATTISAKIFAPSANRVVLLKVEDVGNPGIFAEVQMTTTTAGWQTLSFDFSLASPALNFTTAYKVLSIFYNFGTAGTGEFYHVDSVYFGLPSNGGGPTASISVPANLIGCVGDTILVPISTSGINGVAAISLALDYNSQNLIYAGVAGVAPNLTNGLLANTTGSKFIASWFSVNPTNLTSGQLLAVRFIVGGPSALSWDLATAGNCEIADINGDAIPVSFLNGALNTTGASITGQPTGNTQIQVNGSTSFSVAANGANGYQWQVLNGQQWANLQNNNLYSGTTTNSLSITAAPLSLDNSTYRVLVQGSCPLPVVSDPITLFVTGGSTIGAINLPITWDDPALVYTVTDFGGALSLLAPDPTNTANTTLRTQKTAGAQTWAGTTLSPPAGLGTAIPFAAGATTISAKIFAPSANRVVLLKVEDVGNPGIFAEVQMTTTTAGWQTLSFDFSLASPALNFTTAYKVLSIFYNFGTAGTGEFYHVDSVYFGLPSNGGGPTASISVPANLIGCVGDTLSIPVLNTQVNGLAAISLALNYNTQQLQFVGFANAAPAISNGLLVNANNSKVLTSWFSTNAINLSAGTLLELRFVLQGTSSLQWDTQTPGNCELADINGNVIPATFVNGLVTSTGITILSQPADATVDVGDVAGFSVDANGVNNYEWQYLIGTQWTAVLSDSVHSGMNTPSLQLTNVPFYLNGRQYRVKLMGACLNPVFSNPATLSVNPGQLPAIEVYLQSGLACVGDTLDVNVKVDNLQLISAISLVLQNPAQAVSFVGFKNVHPSLGTNLSISNTSDRVSLAWFNVQPITLPTQTTLVTYRYVVQANAGLSWDLQTPGNCELADLNGIVRTANFTNTQIQANPAPIISSQPNNQLVANNDTAQFAVQAINAVSFQWQRLINGNWSNLTDGGVYVGAETPILRVVASPALSGATYRVRVAGNCQGFLFSQSASLTVAASNLVVNASVGSFTPCVGQTISVPVVVTNFVDIAAFSLTLGYDTSRLQFTGFTANAAVQNGAIVNSVGTQIRASWFNINPATIGNGTLITLQFLTKSLGQSTLVWNTTQQGANEFADFNGTVLLSTFTNGLVNVSGTTASITQQPISSAVIEGSTASFSVSASNATTYQWQELVGNNWVNLANQVPYNGVNTATLNIANTPIGFSGKQYRVVVSGQCPPTANSQPVTLTVNPNAARIVVSLPNQAVCAGGNVVVPISIENFNQVATFSLRILYNQSNLTFTGVSGVPAALQATLAAGASNGRVNLSWFGLNPVSLGAGTLLNLNFVANGSSTLVWDTVSAGSGQIGNLSGNNYLRTLINGSVTANPLPVVQFPTLNNVCISAAPFALQASPAGGTFSGNGVVQGQFNPAQAGVGTHIITYSFTDTFGCSNAATRSITILALPTGGAGADQIICIGTSASLTATGGVSYLWSTGATTQTIIVSPIVTTDYTVQITNAVGCSILDTVQVNIFSDPNMTAGPDVSVCAGGTVQLQASGATQYFWSPATGLSANNIANPIANPQQTTTYIVAGLTGSGCVSLDTIVVTVNPRPVIQAGSDLFVCNGNPVQLNATGGVSYSWAPASGLSASNIANPMANPAVTTRYVVTGTNANGCTNNDTVMVYVPVINAGSNQTICRGGTATLGASLTGYVGTGVTYSWSPATGLSATNVANPSASPLSTTIYTVTATTVEGCVLSGSVAVIVNPTPSIDAGINMSIAPGASVVLNATATGGILPYAISWSPVAGLSAVNILSPTASPTVTTTYYLTVSGNNSCGAIDSITITIDSTLLGKNIQGKLVYDNTLFSPLNSGSVVLNDSVGVQIATTNVNAAASYLFQNLADAPYILRGSTNQPWGGVTSADAFLINSYFADPTLFTGLKVKAGDVNNDGAVNGNDALQTLQRAVNNISSFVAGDWVYAEDTVQLAGQNLQHDVRALCVGDVNGSYNPGLRVLPKVILTTHSQLTTGRPASGKVLVPLYLEEGLELAALQLELILHPGDVLEEVLFKNSGIQPIFTQHGQMVKIGWFATGALLQFKAGDELLKLSMRTNGFGERGLPFELVGQSELVNRQAEAYHMIGLRTPTWTSSSFGSELTLKNYPNPTTSSTKIDYVLPESGDVKLVITDLAGRMLDIPVSAYQVAGQYQFDWTASGLSSGMYFIRLELYREGSVQSVQKRMIIQK